MSEKVKVAWGITGAGDYLRESLDAMRDLTRDFGVEVTVLLSTNGELVVKWYDLWDDLNASFDKVRSEKGPNLPFLAGPLQLGHYAFLFVSPATGNTVAKIAYGIADSLVTNCVAQTVKGGTPVFVYPVDQVAGSQETEGPRGERITISTRQIDLDNVEKLKAMPGVEVLGHPGQISSVVKDTLFSEVS